jgi:hypothetical protein
LHLPVICFPFVRFEVLPEGRTVNCSKQGESEPPSRQRRSPILKPVCLGTNKSMAMSPAGPRTGCASEDQQVFTRPDTRAVLQLQWLKPRDPVIPARAIYEKT